MSMLRAMAEPLPKPWTVEDFLAWEAQQPERHEFFDGRIVMMVGGSAAHATVRDNVLTALRRHLQGGPCRAFSQELKVVTATTVHYPDVLVACVPVEPREDRVREPCVIIEVLSPSTADRDRGAKWLAYQEISSLQHYVLVAQDERRVDLFTRASEGWTFKVVRPPAVRVDFPAIGVGLTLEEVYAESGT